MGAMQGAVDAAPEWFQERRVELRGENYPDIRTVPQIDRGEIPKLDAGSQKLVDPVKAKAFLENPRAQAPTITSDDILAWVRSRQQVFDAISAPFLGEFIAPDTSVFDAPRGQLPPGAR